MVKYQQRTDYPEEWLSHIHALRGPKDILWLKTAIDFYHNDDNQKDLLKKGLSIADILLTLGLDNETLLAAIIYPGLQAHHIHMDVIAEHFNEECYKLLHNLLRMQSLGRLQQLEQRKTQIENLRKMLLAMVTDVRAVLILLAERLWQLRQAKLYTHEEQQHLAQETLDLYAPLANRLGVWQLKWEIEDLCLRYLQPEAYTKIAKWLTSRREERENYLNRLIATLTNILKEAHITDSQVTGRAKHIYSIYRKMLRKNARFEDIYDISALRVLVPQIKDCYTVLSILQNTWQQIPKEFDDYIAHPKPNGYRSIHTLVTGPENHIVEIQIRTYQMHNESELGVAAHWRYKEGVLQTSSYESKIALLRQIMAWEKEVSHAHETQLKQPIQDLFADRIYVFTPLGDIIDLPRNATPLDFAYQVHSEVGHRCRGAKINGNIVPLTYHLQTGERVEILTTKEANPSRDWLNPQYGYLNTARARAKVQHWFRIKDSVKNIENGRMLLEKELKKHNIPYPADLNKIAIKLNHKNESTLLEALVNGDIRAAQIIHHLTPTSPILAPITTKSKPIASPSNIQILGINNLLTQHARCCKPLPGDAIIGYITRNRGVSIHRRNCANILSTKTQENRLVEVSWGQQSAAHHPVDLQLRIADRVGLLRDITSLLASEKINVLGLQTQKLLNSVEVDIYLTIEITDIQQLKKALGLLKQIPNIVTVRRR